ncbi:MAG: OmpA family protein [Bacteroidetes bacterium]|nr:OmpA family protein [Bacteroidota bacterium]
MASVDPEDIQFNGKARYYLADSKGDIVRVSHPLKGNDFVFEHLPFDQTDLSEVYSDEDLTLSGVLSHGNSPTVFIKNAYLFLKNTFGDVVDTAKTNDLGCFVFKNLVSKQDYLVSISDTSLHLPPGTEVVLRDRSGKSLKNFIVGKDNFDFKLLSHEKSVLSELATDEELKFKFNNCTYGQEKLTLRPVSNRKVYLLDGKGVVVDSMYTNQKGLFKFKNLSVDNEYMTAVEEGDVQFANKTSYYLVNLQGRIIKASYPFKNKKFVFNSIPFDSLSLQEMTTDDKLLLAGNLRFGPQGKDPVKHTRVYLLSADGTVKDSVVTNEQGCFAFRNLPSGQNYTIDMNESDMHLPANTKVYLTDKNGKVIKTFEVGKDVFSYKVLSVEKNLMSNLEVSDEELSMKINGYVYDSHKKGLANATVRLFDPMRKQLENVTTDDKGKFSFRNTKMNQADRLEVTSKNVNDSIVYIADSRGKICKQLQKNSEGTFAYKLLEVDKVMMGDFTMDDPWLQVIDMKASSETLTIIERIFYKTNDYKFDSLGQKILDKTINVLNTNSKLIIELSSHTDSRSNDAYNLKLSNKRAQYAVDYIVSKGINKSRLKAIGYGETKLLNQCANGVSCSDKEHAQNRRTEFKITYGK